VSGRRGRLRALANTVAVVGQITAAGVIGAVLAPRVAEAATSVSPAARAPLAAALSTASGSWAVVAMGQRGAPLNTFWQIFFRASGAASWTLVTPTGVADNGGLTLSAASEARSSLNCSRISYWRSRERSAALSELIRVRMTQAFAE